uniref:Uncharacterized protein n=1 Tax=Chromera velia CCMP2878 TaxID=1169474 RepID=A0A0G4H8P0_9ALVE|mmetsp:Transcript_37208/g.73208  ORF Transcript_37208/g.73208 Transcript_37208/m.73208 type:complete len:197 (+) Transcript_37208:196-786(+)|eukprot:Cvel_5910.t1-p1 / transcript=Cvel_5910.t1 / gene=Cvel_5910 / organism=Chromera_velia_CCMP2878 / gene_product=hypothetical protein / transcript_product=hypothetical protein / location=Cvel_scaffold282:22162-23623(-) / protein_length=196 / sequence_SO=supercontig / SO=protein_coding / is_pseudo=false
MLRSSRSFCPVKLWRFGRYSQRRGVDGTGDGGEADLKGQIADVRREIAQVKAALGLADGDPGGYGGKSETFLENQLTSLNNQLTELQKQKNLLLQQQQDSEKKRNKKKIKVLNEEDGSILVWSLESQEELVKKLERMYVYLVPENDPAVDVDHFDELEASTEEELRDPTRWNYRAKPTLFQSKFQYSNRMAANVAQ